MLVLHWKLISRALISLFAFLFPNHGKGVRIDFQEKCFVFFSVVIPWIDFLRFRGLLWESLASALEGFPMAIFRDVDAITTTRPIARGRPPSRPLKKRKRQLQVLESYEKNNLRCKNTRMCFHSASVISLCFEVGSGFDGIPAKPSMISTSWLCLLYAVKTRPKRCVKWLQYVPGSKSLFKKSVIESVGQSVHPIHTFYETISSIKEHCQNGLTF